MAGWGGEAGRQLVQQIRAGREEEKEGKEGKKKEEAPLVRIIRITASAIMICPYIFNYNTGCRPNAHRNNCSKTGRW